MDPAKMRVVDLRAELRAHGLYTKGNKSVLVERLKKALQENTEDAIAETVYLDTSSEEPNEAPTPRRAGPASRTTRPSSSSQNLGAPAKKNNQESLIDQQAKKTTAKPKLNKMLSSADWCIKRKSDSRDVNPTEPPSKRSRSSMCNGKCAIAETANLDTSSEEPDEAPTPRRAGPASRTTRRSSSSSNLGAPAKKNNQESLIDQQAQKTNTEPKVNKMLSSADWCIKRKSDSRDVNPSEPPCKRSRSINNIPAEKPKLNVFGYEKLLFTIKGQNGQDRVMTAFVRLDQAVTIQTPTTMTIMRKTSLLYSKKTSSRESHGKTRETETQSREILQTRKESSYKCHQSVQNITKSIQFRSIKAQETVEDINAASQVLPIPNIPVSEYIDEVGDHPSTVTNENLRKYYPNLTAWNEVTDNASGDNLENNASCSSGSALTTSVQTEPPVTKWLPNSTASPQLGNGDVTKLKYVQVHEESHRLPYDPVPHLVAENSRALEPFVPRLGNADTSACVYSTTDAFSAQQFPVLSTHSADFVEAYQPAIANVDQPPYVAEENHSEDALVDIAKPENIVNEPVEIIEDQSSFVFEETNLAPVNILRPEENRGLGKELQSQWDGYKPQLLINDNLTDVHPNYEDVCGNKQVMMSGIDSEDLNRSDVLQDYESQDGTFTQGYGVSTDSVRYAWEFDIGYPNGIYRVPSEDLLEPCIQCVFCNWFGARITLERHIRQVHADTTMKKFKNKWKISIRLDSVINEPLWTSYVIDYADMLFVLSVKYQQDPGQFCAALSVVAFPDPNPKSGRIKVVNDVTGQDFVWKGEIPSIHDAMPRENVNPCLTIPLWGLDLLPRSYNKRRFTNYCDYQTNELHPQLRDVKINMFVKVFY